MAGLLDMLDTASRDPATAQGILRFGLSLLQSKGNFGNAVGQAGMAGLQGAQDYRQQQFQKQIQQSQLDQLKRQKEMQNLPGQFATPAMKLPTQDNADVGQPGEPPVTPAGFDFGGYVNALMGKDPMQALQLKALTDKDTSPLKIGKDDRLVDRKDPSRIILDALPDQTKNPAAVQEYLFAVKEGYKGNFESWSKEQANLKAPKTTVSVNTGQKGFDNTLKLRGDFRSEPIYKAHQEVQSAYSQIKQGLEQSSPAGDLASATKIMKLLDPGSVVRESELGRAMAATGLADRVANYATNIMKGTKLTPAQRKDFQSLADRLYGESVKQYNAKRGEYQGIAERNQLSTQDVLGPEVSAPSSSTSGTVLRFDRNGNPVK